MDLRCLLNKANLGDKGQTTPDLLIGVGIFLLATTVILVQGGGLFFPTEFTATTNPHVSDRLGTQIVQDDLHGGGEGITKDRVQDVLTEVETNDTYIEEEYGEDNEIRLRVIVLETGNTTQTTLRRKPPMFDGTGNPYTVKEENGEYVAIAETDGFERGTTTRTKAWMDGERVTVEVTA